MTEFKAGDKVRVNEGELEGVTGTVSVAGPHSTIVHLKMQYGDVSLPIYTEMLVPVSEEHDALKTVKLYPDLTKGGHHWFRITTYVGGIFYTSMAPIDGPTLLSVLRKPPAGLYSVESIAKAEFVKGQWRMLWMES